MDSYRFSALLFVLSNHCIKFIIRTVCSRAPRVVDHLIGHSTPEPDFGTETGRKITSRYDSPKELIRNPSRLFLCKKSGPGPSDEHSHRLLILPDGCSDLTVCGFKGHDKREARHTFRDHYHKRCEGVKNLNSDSLRAGSGCLQVGWMLVLSTQLSYDKNELSCWRCTLWQRFRLQV